MYSLSVRIFIFEKKSLDRKIPISIFQINYSNSENSRTQHFSPLKN